MEESQHADADLALLAVRTTDAQQQQGNNGPEFFHRAAPASTLAIMRAATSAAMYPGRPCNRTSSTPRGWSAGNTTTANPSPGAFFLCVHGAVPVLASADIAGNSTPTALAVPFCAERASPCSTGLTSGSREWWVNSR